jgi:hypothetical protein
MPLKTILRQSPDPASRVHFRSRHNLILEA